jgi:hypothetical protein
MKTSHLQNFNVDKLTRNRIMDTIEWDKKDNLDKSPKQRQNKHQDDLLKAIRSCGVTFNIWEKQNADGKGSGLYDLTSLYRQHFHIGKTNDVEILGANICSSCEGSICIICSILENVERIFEYFGKFQHAIYNRGEKKDAQWQ